MGGIEVMDRSPSTFLHPQTSDQGGKRQILVSQPYIAKYTLQNLKYSKNIVFMADIHLSHATPDVLKHLLQR